MVLVCLLHFFVRSEGEGYDSQSVADTGGGSKGALDPKNFK